MSETINEEDISEEFIAINEKSMDDKMLKLLKNVKNEKKVQKNCNSTNIKITNCSTRYSGQQMQIANIKNESLFKQNHMTIPTRKSINRVKTEKDLNSSSPLMQKICDAVKVLQRNLHSPNGVKTSKRNFNSGKPTKLAIVKKTNRKVSDQAPHVSNSDEELLSTFVSNNKQSKLVCKETSGNLHNSPKKQRITRRSSNQIFQANGESAVDLNGKQLRNISKMIRNLDTTLLGTSISSSRRSRCTSSLCNYDADHELEEEDYPLASLQHQDETSGGKRKASSKLIENSAKRMKIENDADDDVNVAIAASLAMMCQSNVDKTSANFNKPTRGRPRTRIIDYRPKGPRGRPRKFPIVDIKQESNDTIVKPSRGRPRLMDIDKKSSQHKLNSTTTSVEQSHKTPRNKMPNKPPSAVGGDAVVKSGRGRPKKTCSSSLANNQTPVVVATSPKMKTKRKSRKNNVFIDTGPPEDPTETAWEQYRHQPPVINGGSLLDYDLPLDPFNFFNECQTKLEIQFILYFIL